ncbi:MAG: tetratricopeptide repeat protein [Candidatus Electrothrix sp. Rat3]|nr:tetratricopeptide repeat protein [Candidatus Electrothrix rattekaaiensis]
MDNRFENKGKDQNIVQGDRAIGKQVNITQKVTGNNNVVSATGDIHVHPEPAPVIPRQLPYLDACFLGRDKELTEMIEQLHPGKVVAVCGPGGMGKSALAAQAVHKLEQDRFPDGIVFHSFYHQASTDMALQTICHAFQVEAKAGLAGAVQAALAGKKALLILDGTEEAEDLKAVLDLRSTCGVLITSRKRSDAQKHRLDLKPLENKQAVDVFCEYSGAEADDESVQGICEILDGWPVGLRIAGRYVSSTGESTADYLRWLEQEPFQELGDGEHQEENAALLLRRSVSQVSEDSRLVLGVAGTLTFAPIAREPVVDLLDENVRRTRTALNELVNYGLLDKREKLWQISHALIHTYAHTKLFLNKKSLERLAHYYMCFCTEQSKAGWDGYVRLDGEWNHCLRLIAACFDSELWQEVQGLERAIWNYLDRRGWWRERLPALEMRLKAAQKVDDRKDEGVCMNNIGYTYDRLGKHNQALFWHKQSLSIRREINDKEGEGVSLSNIGDIYQQQGEHEQALQYFERSLSIAQEIGDQELEGTILNNIGRVYHNQGNYKQALHYYEQCLPIARELGHYLLKGTTLNNIGAIYREQGTLGKALEYSEQALAIRRQLRDRAGEAESCWNMGIIYIELEDFAHAGEYMGLAMNIAEKMNLPTLNEWRVYLTQVEAVLSSRWRFCLYKIFMTLLKWVRARAARRGA